MELNQKVESMLTSEQKANFQKDNGKYKMLNNIIILPIVTTILGIYLENFIIVGVSILLIIIFLILKTYSYKHKNMVYEKEIIPIVLNEKFEDVICMEKKEEVINNFENSKIIDDYDKIEVDRTVVIRQQSYVANISKIDVYQENIQETDGMVEKELEEKMCGIFAYIRLPEKSLVNFKATKKGLNTSLDSIIKITNDDFDKDYDVYSNSPVEVRNFLSSAVMARILDFNSSINKIISFSIYEDMLYIAIDYKEFLEFKGENKKYVNEEKAFENLKVLDVLDMFVTYIINM